MRYRRAERLSELTIICQPLAEIEVGELMGEGAAEGTSSKCGPPWPQRHGGQSSSDAAEQNANDCQT